VEVSAIAHLEGLSRRPFQAAERNMQRVMGAVSMGAGHIARAAGASGADVGGAGLSASAGHYAAQVGQSSSGEEHPLSEKERYGPAATPEFIAAQSAPTFSNGAAGRG
jgi:hypothetical protein